MRIRLAEAQDRDAIWRILGPVFAAGETYAVRREISREEALAYWLQTANECFVAEIEGVVVGTYILRANQAGGGSHVSNCGYMTDPAHRGRGVARAMAMHSFDRARDRGFRAMQFNCVVATNEGAIRLWTALGFQIVGRLPGAFDHPRRGFVDALVMYRHLSR